jgi:hypothetical protein
MSYPHSIEKIARILRIKPENLQKTCLSMDKMFNMSGILDQIIAENNFRVKEILGYLNLSKNSSSEEIYEAIIFKLKNDDNNLFEILGKPSCKTKEHCGKIVSRAREITNVQDGFFLKIEKAKEILEKYPPQNIMKALGYKDVKALLAKEDFNEVYASLRFVESNEWMTEFLNQGYKNIKPSDFEKREIKVLILNNKWLKVAEKFIKKKYHNVSHLKELGIIFIIPLEINSPGETLRVFSLLLHYLHEIDFYSKIIGRYAEQENFVEKLISALCGDVSEKKDLPEGSWRIVQRYLAKDDANDFRLLTPHVNPETIHWEKAENDISKLDALDSDFDFTFWKDLNFVGDFFRGGNKYSNGTIENKIVKENGEIENLVSMNLIDSVMSLVKEKEMIKYLYHHQEAMWNKIFTEYLGKKNLEELIRENFYKGYVTKEDIKKFIK